SRKSAQVERLKRIARGCSSHDQNTASNPRIPAQSRRARRTPARTLIGQGFGRRGLRGGGDGWALCVWKSSAHATSQDLHNHCKIGAAARRERQFSGPMRDRTLVTFRSCIYASESQASRLAKTRRGLRKPSQAKNPPKRRRDGERVR